MQTGKKAVESVKETASNIAASAKSGMDKTKATAQEKVDKMRADDDYDKALASEKKQDRVTEAELRKQQAMSHNAAEKDAKTAVAGHTGTGGTVGSHPIGRGTGTNTTAENRHVGGGTNTGYTGTGYSA